MPGRQEYYSVSIPVSASPPQDLSSYARFMHDHTKRQMQAFGANPSTRRHNATTINGTSNSSSSPTDYHS